MSEIESLLRDIKELKRQAALQRLNGWDDLARQTEKKIAKLKKKSEEVNETT